MATEPSALSACASYCARLLCNCALAILSLLTAAQAAAPPPVDVNQWLSANPTIATNVLWQTFASSPFYWSTAEDDASKNKWINWSSAQKADLQVAYQSIYDSYYGVAGEWLSDMPDNKALQFPGYGHADTWISPADAWSIYVHSVAQSLFIEVHKIVPWTLFSLDQTNLRLLLDSRRMFARVVHNGVAFYSLTGSGGTEIRDSLPSTMPATPYAALQFMLKNDLLDQVSEPATAQLNTIGKLVAWSSGLSHWASTPNDPDLRMSHWQYAGLPPPSRIIQGTFFDNPNDGMAPLFGHWTFACNGTAGFYKQILRAVNIPVQVSRVCGHGIPVFRASARFITHGDNAYHERFKALQLPASILLRPEAEFVAMFGGSSDTYPVSYNGDGTDPSICANVSSDPTGLWARRPALFRNGFDP